MKPTQEKTEGQDDDVMAGWTGVQSSLDQGKLNRQSVNSAQGLRKGRTGHGATAELNFARVSSKLDCHEDCDWMFVEGKGGLAVWLARGFNSRSGRHTRSDNTGGL
jgi:dethiobiotin synthetase